MTSLSVRPSTWPSVRVRPARAAPAGDAVGANEQVVFCGELAAGARECGAAPLKVHRLQRAPVMESDPVAKPLFALLDQVP
jgi:hypothetical protein